MTKQIPALDGFRAIAISIVIASHAGLGALVPGGFGVTIFFFLSGFLITTLLRVEHATTGRVDLKAFYLRRSLRIFPPFYITIALVALAAMLGAFNGSVNLRYIGWDLLFLSNYSWQIDASSMIPIPLWSLNVEEHFYIAFSALFAFVLARIDPRKAAKICLALCAATLLVRIANVALLPDYSNNYYWSHTRIDSILFGSCLAFFQNPVLEEKAWRPKMGHVALAALVLLACLGIRNDVFRETLRYTLQGGALFVVFSAAIQAEGVVARLMNNGLTRIIALLSYTLYLAHVPLIRMFEEARLPAPELLGIAAAVAYSAVMYRLVEKPCGNLRRRLEKDRPRNRHPDAPLREASSAP
ncbi:acyltransferase family protein [Sphingomonas floccifaciens]|uniref:Acyltransferase family protein n=1 Tax=Sphingomonas floccifaciens TaxID=1844115 RepID=A0ABW4NB10_9SPHN